MKQYILNSSRIFKKMGQNISGKKEGNNDSVTITDERSNSENSKQPPYYETLISKHSRDHGDFWNLSGGLIGI